MYGFGLIVFCVSDEVSVSDCVIAFVCVVVCVVVKGTCIVVCKDFVENLFRRIGF